MKLRTRPRGLAVLALAGVLTLSACGGDSSGGGSAGGGGGEGDGGEPVTLTMLPKNLGNPYFDTSTQGARDAAQQIGAEFEEVGPQEATPDAQVQYINTVAQQGRDALVLSANDPTAVCDALDQARSVGTAVVTFDSDTEPQCRDLFINQATAEGIAQTQVELVAEQIDGEGEIAILSASANATNQNTWIELMQEDLEANYPDIELVDVVYGNDDDQESFDKTAALLQSNPDLEGIVSPTTVGIAAAARYLADSQFQGEVALTGLGTPNQMREYVEDGTVTAFALWNPEDLGALASYAAAALASGEIEGAEGDSFSAGDLGDFSVDGESTVLLGDPFVFDGENIGDFDF